MLYLKLIGAIVPWWAAVAVTAMLPIGHAAALTLDYVNRRRQRRAGLCPSCRYDLTGSVSGVCPECGRPASTGDAA